MRKWRNAARHTAINLGLLAAMWLLDQLGWLPRLYPRLDDGMPVWGESMGAPAGVLLVAVTAGWALVFLWRRATASAKAGPQVRHADD